MGDEGLKDSMKNLELAFPKKKEIEMTTISKKIEIDQEIFKIIKKMAKNKNTTEDELINSILKKEFFDSQNKIPEHLIANKDTYNPNHEKIMKSAGIIETKKPFDTAKAIKEVRSRVLENNDFFRCKFYY